MDQRTFTQSELTSVILSRGVLSFDFHSRKREDVSRNSFNNWLMKYKRGVIIARYKFVGVNGGCCCCWSAPACGQLNREKIVFPVRGRAIEYGLARRVQPSRSASARSFSTPRLNLSSGYVRPLSRNL